MIANPKYGWCDFELGDFKGVPGYLTDVPIELLNAFIDYHTKGYGIAVFDEEGSFFTLVMTQYNCGIFIIEERNHIALHDFSYMNVTDLENELIRDIESDLNGWLNFTVDDDPEETKRRNTNIKQKIAELNSRGNYEDKNL